MPTNTNKNSDKKPNAQPVNMMRPGGNPMAMMGAVDKPKNFKGTVSTLWKYLSPFTWSIILVIIFAISSTVFVILSPKILGNITNDLVDDLINIKIYETVTSKLPAGVTLPKGTKGSDIISKIPAEQLAMFPADRLEKFKNLDLSVKPSFDFGAIGTTAEILVGLYLLSALFNYLQGYIMSGITQKISYRFRKDILAKINKLPLKYFDTRSFGDVLSRITNDVDTVGQNLNQSMIQIITAVTTIIGILIMMISISWLLTIVAIVTLPISFGFIAVIVKKSKNLFKLQQDSLGEMNGHIEEMYSGHTVVKVFNGEARSLEKFNKVNEDIFQSGWKSQFLSGLLFPVMTVVGNIGYVGIAVLGGWLAINGKINIGDIQAFIQYMQQFTQPIIQTANTSTVLQTTVAAAERVFEFLAETEEEEEQLGVITLANVKGDVSFENVKFGYSDDVEIIKGFTAHIKSGQKVAIVGPTGAGKTTMVNLLMRFYDVTSGAIKIDGVDIRTLTRSNLRQMFGMVLQDTWLFNGTIRENIAYGKVGASESEIIAAAQSAYADHFIHALPGGYDMELNEEADNISQGEKQLLTIARAMLANPPMLILDEATSSVDTRTEVLIQKAMETLMKGRTSFVIAHRLSTIRGADLILVMKDGNIVEQGNHESLISQGGFYAELYNSQFTNEES